MSWDATEQRYPDDRIVPQLVALQAAKTPDAIALVADEHVLTYRELEQRANQLAHYLQTLGVGPNVLVGLCIERSLDMIVGLLGILKAGGAYVPLDANYPPDRLTYMLEDAHAPVLVTHHALASRLFKQDTRMVCLDTDAPVLAQQPTAEPINAATIDDLVYVIYTSGSTGWPKGVQITHKSLLNLVEWHQRAFAVTAADRATQLTSPAFDATGWEVWPYLTIGASVHLLYDDSRVDAALCRDWLVNHNITITFLPTVLAERVMALPWPTRTSLRFLLTGADTLHSYPASDLPFAFINNYGPAEATVVSTFGQVLPSRQADVLPSIGRPIDNAYIYILDEQLRQVSPGEPGELHIGGAGLAKGYLNRPELTAEKFIRDPFSENPTARLYKTGDLARYLPDGQIAFMGRIDQQIKIRGYRIEPEEIVSILNGHPGVQSSAVIDREDTPGDKHLVAYIVPMDGTHIIPNELQKTLATHLPDYMIPATFVLLKALPITHNDKLDRGALPVPDANNTLRDEIVAMPQTPLEERLVGIVAPLLNLEQVGIDENFFTLGGHSLLGTQLITKITTTFGVVLFLKNLFDAPTIRQLAAEIERLILAKLEKMSDEEAQELLEQW